MRVRSLAPSLLLTALFLNASPPATAQLATFQDETQFLAAANGVTVESFEQLAARTRSTDPVTVASFTVTPSPGLLGVQDGANSPEDGHGAFATDGTKYLFTYRENQAAGTLRFDLSAPATAFGFDFTDLGETAGLFTLTTNAGESLTPQTALEAPPLRANGNQAFFGIVQSTPFTQVFLTSTGIDDSYGIDKVSVHPTPAPASLLTGLLGAVPGATLLLRRRNVKATPKALG